MSAAAMIFSGVFDGHQLRVVGTSERPLFVAADVCEFLSIQNPSDTLNKRIPEHEKGLELVYTPGGNQPMAVVTEQGFYRLVFRSNKPEATRLQDLVFGEVLPSIRKTGSYAAPGAEGGAAAPDRLSLMRARLATIPDCAKALKVSSQPMDDEFLAFVTRSAICEAFGLDTEIVKRIAVQEAEAYEREDDLQDRLERIETRMEASELREGELTASQLAKRFGWFSLTGRPHRSAVVAAARAAGFAPNELRPLVVQVSEDRFGRTYAFTPKGVERFAFLDSCRDEAAKFEVQTDARTFTVYRTPEGAASEGGAS